MADLFEDFREEVEADIRAAKIADIQANSTASNVPITPADATPPPLKSLEGEVLPGQTRLDPVTLKVVEGPGLTPDQLVKLAYQEEFKNFGYRIDEKTGERIYYEPAFDFKSTAERVRVAFGEPRANDKPDIIMPWEMRIGGARFVVPPININVYQTFKAGSLSGGALRSNSSPKFNSGYSETTIDMTLYFPNQETIWGFEGDAVEIDFEHDDYQLIDRMLGSLRGLIAQFKYAPFLPVRNQYLNEVYGITGVALQSMSISTVPGFPFCVVVNLSMLRFNHRVYLPMVEHFDNAIHWGKFRQYMGRAMSRLQEAATKKFLLNTDVPVDETGQPLGSLVMSLTTATEVLEQTEVEDIQPIQRFSKWLDFNDGRFFEIYYPYQDPAAIELPKEGEFKPEDGNRMEKGENWWQKLLGIVGIEPSTDWLVETEQARSAAEAFGHYENMGDEARKLNDWLTTMDLMVSEMKESEFEKWANDRIESNPQLKNANEGTKRSYKRDLRQVWVGTMYNAFLQDPSIAKALAFQDLKNQNLFINEWEVPMRKVGLSDPPVRDAIQVQAVSVSMGNNIARMQVQLHQEPVHQHIGGMDTTASISMIVFGEQPLKMLRRTFDNIAGLARLEHQKGVLGFIGIKNVLTALCGMRYCLPQSFEVETIPNYPHCYNVRLSLTDFDIFQQKREMLSNTQQAEMIHTFKTKKNPFLRIKQLWGAFNAYPDFPLAVRDGDGNVVGNLDPDFYFRAYETFEEDLTDLGQGQDLANEGQLSDSQQLEQQARAEVGLEFIAEDGIHHCMGKVDDPKGEWVSITKNGVSFRSGEKTVVHEAQFDEPHVGNMCVNPYVKGLSPASDHQQPYLDNSGSPRANYAASMQDLRYRDKAGRMVRAFPTYMLWIIDENGMWGGVKMFDNFYGLQSVLDFSIHESEDILGDTLLLRISNIYSRLTTPFQDLLDEQYSQTARMINTALTRQRRLATGFGDYLVNLDTIELKPGVRVHMRMGYSSNPNNLDIVFNGVITSVEVGEVMTLVCQSDAIELGAIVNPTNKDGHTGKIDGNMMGLYLSEPRDLMIRLLTMGSGVFREMFAQATAGKVFSENRFGIRHFGSILYQEMNDDERTGQVSRKARITEFMMANPAQSLTKAAGAIVGLVNPTIGRIMDDLWINMSMKRDYELFKRNIYPGNGSGIAQYMGGDLGEGALDNAMMPTGVDEAGQLKDSATGEPIFLEQDPIRILQDAQAYAPEIEDANGDDFRGKIDAAAVVNKLGGGVGPKVGHAMLQHLGITSRGDDDIQGFDEVSFRAQTHMKTVWDLFQVCAALLPNYVVAVRPFEDRSTVFYGKPHWTYTSAVIPVSLGVGIGQDGKNNEPLHELPDAELQNLYDRLSKELGRDRQQEDFYNALTKVHNTDPTQSTSGMVWDGKEPQALPSEHPVSKVKISKRGKLQMGMHLPTSIQLDQDIGMHMQVEGLDPRLQHPYYMDRSEEGKRDEGDQGGSKGNWNEYKTEDKPKTAIKGDKGDWPGRAGAFGVLPPEAEQYYIAQNWTQADIEKLSPTHTRIMVYNPRTNRACICAPGDTLSAGSGGGGSIVQVVSSYTESMQTVVSPDVVSVLSLNIGMDECFIGFVDDDHSMGPVRIATSEKTGEDKAPGSSTSSSGAAADSKQAGKDPTKDPEVQAAIARSNAAIGALHLDWLKEGTDPAQYAFEHGWEEGDIPVNYGNQNVQDAETGLYDEAGAKAYLVYENQRTQEQAEKIWDEFRKDFVKEKIVKNIFYDRFPNLKRPEEPGGSLITGAFKTLATGGINKDFFNAAKKSIESTGFDFSDAAAGVVKGLAGDVVGSYDELHSLTEGIASRDAGKQEEAVSQDAFEQILESFMKFMWQNPYHRGWVVLTADTQFHLLSSIFYDAGAIANARFQSSPLGWVPGVSDVVGNVIEGVSNVVGGIVEGVAGFFGADKQAAREWNFDQAHKAWQVFITEGASSAAAWMKEHSSAGKDQKGLLLRVGEEAWKRVGEPILDAVKQVVEVAWNTLTGVAAFIRLAMLQLSQGMSMASDMQKRTNMLNRVFNDSLYYRAGAPNSLSRLCDNPFTREYGEPVVEIRQPFQRVHFLSSFQHICKNGIIENTDDVMTVVTAISNGAHPVTVHFDKGAAPEYQKEKVVETGLFWDKPGGFPLLKSIPIVNSLIAKPLGSMMHPVGAQRRMIKESSGVTDEICSKRVGLYHLRESLKNLYTGELIVLGDASIRPHDLVYLGDIYERMYGFFEVEAVTHHFTPETGFITSIVPNALVTINDPARWSYISYLNSRMSIRSLRGRLRESLKIRADSQNKLLRDESYTLDQMVDRMSNEVLDATQFSGGMSALVKDFASLGGMSAMFLPGQRVKPLAGPITGNLGKTAVAVGTLFGKGAASFDDWGIWGWVKKNLLDQHGCYIQYLTHKGNPMDGGLTPNSSVAVGQMHGYTLVLGGLRFNLSGKDDISGQRKITSSELLNRIGWNAKEIADLGGYLDSFTSDMYVNLEKLAQRGISYLPFVDHEVHWVKITKVIDGDTYTVASEDGYSGLIGTSGTDATTGDEKAGVRALIVDAPEDPYKDDKYSALAEQNRNHPGVRATNYARARLAPNGEGLEVAVRILKTATADRYGRALGFVFHNGPPGASPSERKEFLMRAAKGEVEFDAFTEWGDPYTFNWELLMTGLAKVEVTHFGRSLPGVYRGGGFG